MPSLSTHLHVFTNLGSSLHPLHLGYLCKLHHMDMMGHKPHSQPISPLWRMGGLGLKIPSVLSGLGLSSDKPSAKSPPKERQDINQSSKKNTNTLQKINIRCYDKSLHGTRKGLSL